MELTEINMSHRELQNAKLHDFVICNAHQIYEYLEEANEGEMGRASGMQRTQKHTTFW
jgi:hypothetical protein